jgi:hypothetical protein
MRIRISSVLILALVAVPTLASAQRQGRLARLKAWSENHGQPRKIVPDTFQEAVRYTGQNMVRGARFALKGGKWAALGTATVVAGAAAVSGVAGVLGADHLPPANQWFDPSVMNATLEAGKQFGRDAIAVTTSPAFLKTAGAGMGLFVGYPIGTYAAGKAVKAWRENPYMGDTTIALLAAGGSIALGNTNPGNVAINYIIGQGSSAGARLAVNGTAALARKLGR